jgi:CrcB protein
MTVVLVLAGGAVGAPLPNLTDLFVQARHDSVSPWGTLSVNVAGSLVLGVLAGWVTNAGCPPWVLTLGGTGFCGALTTFSTFGFETVRLLGDGSWLEALTNAGLGLGVGMAAVLAGWWLGSVPW